MAGPIVKQYYGKKISEMWPIQKPLTQLEYIHIVQNGENKRIRVSTFIQEITIFIQRAKSVNYIQESMPPTDKIGALWYNPATGSLSVVHPENGS